MYLINNNNISDPYLNLALEEYCLRNLDTGSDYLLFYVNAPSIVVGKHQNLFQEFNFEYAQENRIHLVRRTGRNRLLAIELNRSTLRH